ncbi:hypothetical protein PV410_24755 [Streptomyces sp. PA03-5A]|nr:hypothetical protein [Streptomyces sp. PA03-5A]
MTGPGSLERVASLLGNALGALGGALADPGAVLSRLGVALDDEVLAPAGPAAASVVAAAVDLVDAVAALDVSIGGDDTFGITTNGAVVVDRIATVLSGLSTWEAAVTGALGSLDPARRARAGGLLSGLPGRVLSLVVVDGLRARMPTLSAVLTLTGLIEARDVPGDPADPAFPSFVSWTVHWGRIGRLLTDPLSLPRDAYGFGAASFDGTVLLGMLARLVDDGDERSARPYVTTGTGGIGAVLQAPGFVVAVEGSDLLFPQRFGIQAASTRDEQLGERVTATLGVAGTVPADAMLRLSPDLTVSVTPASTLTASVTVTAGKAGERVTVLGLTGVAGLSVETVAVTISVTAGKGVTVGVTAASARLDLDLGGAGGLLKALLPKDLAAGFDLGLDLSGGAVRVRGGAGLAASFPVRLSLGAVEVTAVTVGLAAGGSGVPVELSASLRTSLGPLTILVERIGVIATLDAPAGGGNLGPLQIEAGFRPPNGLGIAMDAGPISGGGFLAVDGNRYAGVLQVKLSFLAITAYGLYEQTNDGSPSFVAVLGIRFWPGIQLGFGFAITGVGGLVGLNRRADVDLLRQRLASGAAGNVLFCDDPVKNAPTLLGDLAAFFPAQRGSFVVGPTFQLSWVAPIVRVDVAILIELPGPSRIVILGSVKVMIGIDETFALLYLRMDFLGVLDFEQKLISLDAYLVNSHALGVFRLTGGMAFRLSYGANPYILLSVGGFHPRFDPGPLNLPVIARVGAVLDVNVVARIYLRLEMYVAFTSNTLQLGAKVEAGLELGPISAHGYLSFDALIQFRPFAFDFAFAAGFSIEVFDVSLCSVDVSGRLTGPGPLVVHAEASVRLLFVKVSGSATVSLGGNDADRPAPVPSIVQALKPELSRRENLRAEGEDVDVVLKPGIAVDGVLVSPVGALIWEQKRAPLETLVDRFEGAPLTGKAQLALTGPAGWAVTDESDWFSPGTFTSLDLAAAQTMNNATFQVLRSGIRIASGGDAKAPTAVPYSPKISLVKRPSPTRFAATVGSYLTPALAAALSERDTTPRVEAGLPKVAVVAETYDVHSAGGTTVASGETPFQAFQLSRLGPGLVATPSADVVVTL